MSLQSIASSHDTPTTRPIFIFASNNIRYGFEAHHVREVFFLPLVEPLPEAPRDIIGAIDVRGRIVPVMDLELRFGLQPRDYQVTDSVVVFESEGVWMALVVSSVFAVQEIPLRDFRDAPAYGRGNDGAAIRGVGAIGAIGASNPTSRQHRFMSGMAQTIDGAIRLLDCGELVHYSESVELPDEVASTWEEPEALTLHEFFPHATEEERDTLRQRAIALQTRPETETQTDQIPLAIIEISGEFFGIDLNVVREFSEVKKVVPVPGCPDRILGSTNLRGEILTLVSLHELTGLPAYTRDNVSSAVVVEVGNTSFGIAIDAVFDVMYLQSRDLAPVPAALQTSDDEFIRGTAAYRQQMISVLDIEAIVQREVLVVNDR